MRPLYLEHDINPGTFYNWVRRFRKQACEFPAPAGKDRFQAVHQEVVKMEIIPDHPSDFFEQPSMEDSAEITKPVAAMELQIGKAVLRMDETRLQVLKEEGRRAQTQSFIWVVRSGEDGLPKIVLYHYTETRAGKHAVGFLDGIKPGYYFMADGYHGYNLLKDGKRCCCYAHIRRYLLEAIPKGHEKDYSDPAVQGVLYCDKLFEYERRYLAKGLSPEQRKKRRLKDEKPVIEAFLSWLDAQTPVEGSRLDRAVTYIRNRKDTLMTYRKR